MSESSEDRVWNFSSLLRLELHYIYRKNPIHSLQLHCISSNPYPNHHLVSYPSPRPACLPLLHNSPFQTPASPHLPKLPPPVIEEPHQHEGDRPRVTDELVQLIMLAIFPSPLPPFISFSLLTPSLIYPLIYIFLFYILFYLPYINFMLFLIF